MIEQGRAAMLAWQHTVNAAWQRQSSLLAEVGALPSDIPPLPPRDASPQDNAAYWRGLTDEQRRRLVREHPELVGARDGIPAEWRDRANRILLDRQKAALEAERQRIHAQLRESPHPGAIPPGTTRLSEIANELDGLAVIEDRLNRGNRYLLGIDTNGWGQDATAIIARGNPDTAANVATYVPGTQSGFIQLNRLLDESDAMYQSANRGPGTNSSVITWLGYDTPDHWTQGVSASYANDANRPLDRFQQGLDAANPDAHHTVVGHSYGSTVVGFAARDGGMPADDIIAIGSPGMGVESADELGIQPQHVWVLEDNQDPVADARVHGNDPGDNDFGANQLPAEPDRRRPTTIFDIDDIEEDLADGELDAHLNYFYNTESTRPSYYDIGDVIAGRPLGYTLDEHGNVVVREGYPPVSG